VTESYLFSPTGLTALARYVRADTLFAFNLDGILAQNIAEYSLVYITDPVKTSIQRLMNVANVMVFSSRSRSDALNILGFEPHLLTGNYGSELSLQECCRNWNNVKLCLKWREQLYDMLGYIDGLEIEFLGESILLLFRKADNPEKALLLINAAIEKLTPLPRKMDGMLVVQLLPGDIITRGERLSAALEHFGSRKAIYFGGDEADEEIFRLEHTDVFGIHVGRNEHTAASRYLHSQSELPGLINSLIGMLEIH